MRTVRLRFPLFAQRGWLAGGQAQVLAAGRNHLQRCAVLTRSEVGNKFGLADKIGNWLTNIFRQVQAKQALRTFIGPFNDSVATQNHHCIGQGGCRLLEPAEQGFQLLFATLRALAPTIE